jgi:UrcA family protein
MNRKIVSSFAAAAVALAFGATTAGAAPAGQVSIRVQVADLNLQSPAGAQVALRRIGKAAEAICGDEQDTRDLGRRALFQACVRSVVDETVANAHSPTLTALNGGPAANPTLVAAN